MSITDDFQLIGRRELIASGGAALALSGFGRSASAKPPGKTVAPDFTRGHYRQQLRELTLDRLDVTGVVPPTLSGVYMRNGHNPKPELVPPYWFAGNGMLHGVRISGGNALWYRNRWVQTPALHGAPLVRKDGSFDLTASAAATSVYAHAGRIYALQEVNLPFLVSPELATLGPFDFGGKLKAPMTAHPKIDPATGEMLFISYGPKPPFLTYYLVSPEGALTHQEPVPGAGPSIMHDFAITPNYVIFFDPSVTFDANSKVAFPYRWDDNYQARVGVMPRDRSKGPVKWYPADPFFYFHIANAWEETDGTIKLESTFYDKPAWDGFAKWLMSLPGHPSWLVQGDKFARWTVNPVAGTVTREMRTDIANDFPTINQKLIGRRTRYTYAEAFPGSGGLKRNALIKIDGQTGNVAVREYPEGQQPEEPWFVPDPQGKAEDDGWLFSYVSDLRTGRSRLEIIDATVFTGKPTAVISLPSWVPAGVHGSWIDDAVVRRS
jgi:carotenoid cleavage dioxygenase